MKPSDLDEATSLLERLAQCDRLLAAKNYLKSNVIISRTFEEEREDYKLVRDRQGAPRELISEETAESNKWKAATISVKLDHQIARNLVIKTRNKTLVRLQEIGVEVACAHPTSAPEPSGTFSVTPNSRRAWFQDGQIVTLNADGGTTALSEKEARELANSLMEILEACNGFKVRQKKSGGAEAPPPSDLPWYRRAPR